ncbi:MAG: FAD-dependent oxidoreductase [Hyphomonadaceae bacterium]|nr:FAD-dependent oxidoreductase [Hyphomonadaceae bacterium]
MSGVLVVGGGIGGLTAAIALRQRGFDVDLIEREPEWTVYGVGIIQQANVIRAMAQLGVVDDYIHAGFGFSTVEIYAPDGRRLAVVPTPRLVEGYPSNVGIGRKALQKVLSDRAFGAGARIRLGVTVAALEDDGAGVSVGFSDGGSGRYDLLIGADGLNSQMRTTLFPEAQPPVFENQGVWRYNLPRPADVVSLHAFEGPRGIGLVPLSETVMYMYLTTPEPGNPRYQPEKLAQTMRDKLAGAAPRILALSELITDDDAVVYKPLESVLLEGPWHKGRCVLIGDAAHATTPHLGQGAGMAIEDSLVLAEELSRGGGTTDALARFQERRFARCRYIVEASRAICRAQVAGEPVDQAKATADMFKRVAEPI